MSAKRVLLGVGVGVVLGILFAPHKGSKTRKRIAETGRNIKEGWDELRENISEKVDSFKEGINDKIEEAVDDQPLYVSSSMQDEYKL